jgi:hypothetical protein
MVLLGDEAQVDARFGLFGDSAILDRCMVCVKCTIGLEIVLDAPDRNPRCRGSSGCSFQSIWR